MPGDKLDSQTVGPGVHGSPNLDVIGTVTLDGGGDPNALFVFESAGALTVADASQIVLAGGAQACNVYWRVAGSATLGSGSTFVGTVIADDAIAAANGTDVVGRLHRPQRRRDVGHRLDRRFDVRLRPHCRVD